MSAAHVLASPARARPLAPLALAALGVLYVAVAIGRVHVRSQATMIGYEIGRLKNEEAKLLEERSFLKMQLAKLTTKKHLQMMTESDERELPAGERTVAQK